MTSRRTPRDYPDYPPYEEFNPRKRLPIPDLRFEQVYLKRIQDCIHVEHAPRIVKERGGEAGVEDTEFTACTHVAPLLNSSQQVVQVDWGKIVYITLRDQVLMPLLQGMVWGIIGTYYRPFVAYARGSLPGTSFSTHPVEGEGVGWLRSCMKKLGFSSITIGPPSV